MTHRNRMLSVLVVSQAICLSIGLWLQNRFVTAIATWEASTADHTINPIGSEISPATDIPIRSAMDTQELSAKHFQDAMVTAMPFGFIWIIGLQAIVAYLVMTRLQFTHSQKEIRSHEASLTRAKELVRTRDAVVFGLAKLAESRDPDTGHHLERIALYSTRLATALRRDRRYRNVISPTFVRSIGISSALHDIGKVGVADSIL
ncbi:MAG: hypothetical protein JW829_16380, partial [Pirellulales bacterium]|nr:hypothetical protein [Pirellulales bacterium]